MLITILGCDRQIQSRAKYESVSYSSVERQERITQALTQAGIPFEFVTGQRNQVFIRWDAAYSAEVKKIEDAVLLPSGRNIRFDPERQARFKAWLEHSQIPYRTMIESDAEYVVWEEMDTERIRAWDEFPPHYDDPPFTQRQ
jgi:hypothetical protein